MKKRVVSLLVLLLCFFCLAACSSNFEVSFSTDTKSTIEFSLDEETTKADESKKSTTQKDEKTKESTKAKNEAKTEAKIDEDGTYSSKEDVALYIHTYGHLPNNYITKKEAQKLGWSGGSLEKYAPGKCIGGDKFGNYEGNLPKASNRTYTECDIDTLNAKSRGAKRIVFSNDGLIYYTEDHYETFTLLYGEP